jgi:hypothetical protein
MIELSWAKIQDNFNPRAHVTERHRLDRPVEAGHVSASVSMREIRRVSRRELSQAGREALARAFWARFNFLVNPAGSRKYGGGSCNPSVIRSYFAPA